MVKQGLASGLMAAFAVVGTLLALLFSIGQFVSVGVFWRQLDAGGAIPIARDGHACEVLGNTMFVHGGRSGVTSWHKSMHILEFDTLKWRNMVSDDKLIAPRSGHSMTRVNDKLFIFGGKTGVFTFSKEMITFDPTTDWFKVLETRGPAPSARQAHSAVAIGKYIYIYGGTDGNNRLSDLYVFDTDRNEWTQPKTSGIAPGEMEGHKAVAHGKKMYLFGGFTGRKFVSDIYVLDTDTMVWSIANSEGKPRTYHSATRVGSYVYVFGGIMRDKLNDVKVFDLDTHKWTETTIHGDIISPRQSHCAVLSQRTGQIYVFGGSTTWTSYFNDLWVLDTNPEKRADNTLAPGKGTDDQYARMELSKQVDIALNKAHLALKLDSEVGTAEGESQPGEPLLTDTILADAESLANDPLLVGLEEKIAIWRQVGNLYDSLKKSPQPGNLKNYSAEISSRMNDIKRIQGNRVALKSQLEQQIKELQNSQNTLKSLEEQVADLTKRKADSVAKQSRLSEQLKAAQKELDEIKARQREASNQVDRAIFVRDDLKQQLDRLQQSRKRMFESYDEAEKRKANIESELEVVREQLNKLADEEFKLQQSSKALSPNVAQLQRRLDRLAELNADVELLKEKYAASRKAIEEYKSTKEAVLDKLKEEISDSASTDEDVLLPPEDDMWINEKLLKLEQRMREMLIEKKANLSTIETKIKEVQRKTRDLKDQEARLVVDLDQITTQMNQFGADRESKDKEIAELEGNWTAALTAAERKKAELQQITDVDIPKKQLVVDDTRKAISDNEKEFSQIQDQESTARKELAKLQLTLTSKLDDLTDSEHRFTQLHNSLDALRREIQVIKARYDADHNTTIQNREQLHKLILRAENEWRTKVANLESEIAQLRTQLRKD